MSQLNRFESIADLDNLPLQNGLRILEINTDGSFYKKDPYAGLGIYIPEQGSQQAIYFSSRLTGHKHNADRAEIQAAVTAVKITFLLHSSYDALIIRTDSQNLIRFVKDWEAMWSRNKDWSQIRVNIEKRFNNRFSECYYHAGEWLKYDSDFEELFTELITLKNSDKTFRVHWQYVRSHSGDHGNDTSDRLAKHGRKLLYDNKQLFESLKLFLLQKKNNNQCLSKKRYFPFNCPHLVEVTQVPVHISTISVVKVMNVNQQNVVKEKVDEYSQATKVITFRITKEAFNTCMKQRKLKIDQHIEVPVNPANVRNTNPDAVIAPNMVTNGKIVHARLVLYAETVQTKNWMINIQFLAISVLCARKLKMN
ncbi:Ribonuclease H1 [Tyrophagus putrescentiae]|nr:Ribonuclease H1 [Tyrophagus putrescentiae]